MEIPESKLEGVSMDGEESGPAVEEVELCCGKNFNEEAVPADAGVTGDMSEGGVPLALSRHVVLPPTKLSGSSGVKTESEPPSLPHCEDGVWLPVCFEDAHFLLPCSRKSCRAFSPTGRKRATCNTPRRIATQRGHCLLHTPRLPHTPIHALFQSACTQILPQPAIH